jgi:hypothetical protein
MACEAVVRIAFICLYYASTSRYRNSCTCSWVLKEKVRTWDETVMKHIMGHWTVDSSSTIKCSICKEISDQQFKSITWPKNLTTHHRYSLPLNWNISKFWTKIKVQNEYVNFYIKIDSVYRMWQNHIRNEGSIFQDPDRMILDEARIQ